MLKQKFLHRKSRKSAHDYTWKSKQYFRGKNVDLFSDDLPFHGKIGRSYGWSNYDVTPLKYFIESKIGEDWNEVYSEILTKIKKKFRYSIDSCLDHWIIMRPIYDDDFIPRNNYGRIISDRLYIDFDNIICKKSKYDILIDSKKYIRRKKMLEIFENIENDISSEN